jgi:16S rRNA (cytidine1402-2'-O)-methyltransferase
VAAQGTLFVVATPIGNLSDITFRALEVLRTVDVIAAEDTRVTRRLLSRYEVHVPMVSYHARNAASRGPELLARLRGGESVALVTDAGTPGVSDPGAELALAWGGEGGAVVPIPGASAALAAISATGIAGPRWSFEGFLPRSGRERRQRLARIAADERGTVVFEAGNRVAATLRDLAGACGGDRPAAVCRELTKLHEEIVRGTLGELAGRSIDERGEVVIVVGAGMPRSAADAEDSLDALSAARADVERRVAAGEARGAAARAVSAATGIPRRALYEVGSVSSKRPTETA